MNLMASIESIGQDLRYALRGLRRSSGFAAVAVVALALGIGANTAVFTVLNGVLLQPLRFPEAERLFLISYQPQHGPFRSDPSLSDRHYLEFRNQDRVFERIAAFAGYPVTLTGAGDPVQLPAATVTPEFFPVLRVNAGLGRTFLAEEAQPGRDRVALVSNALWRTRLGADAQIVGKTITLDGVARTVVGVMPAGFGFPYRAEVWTPFEVRIDPRNSFLRPVVGRLKPGASRLQAQAELDTFARALAAASGKSGDDSVARIVPLAELLVGTIRSSLWIFAGAVGFVLLIACANVANLLLIRATSRQQEIAVRAALGAGRPRLMRQLLTESTLVSLAGGAAGMLLALAGVPALLALAPEGKIPRVEEIHINGWVLAFTLGVSLLTGIVFGLAPALHATRRNLGASSLQGTRTASGRHEGLRSALVVSEIALALVLLTGAGLMLKSFLRMRAVNPGFRAENVLTMTVDLPAAAYRTAADAQAFHQRTLEKLGNLPGVLAAGAVNWMPLGRGLMRGDFQLEGGRKLPRGLLADKLVVSPGYLRTMGIRLLSGRDFSERDNAAAHGVVLISQSVARRLWPGEDAVGKRIAEQDHPKPEDWLTIVGVVDDVIQQDLTERPDPAIYRPYLQVNRPFWLTHMTFLVRTTAEPHTLAPALRSVLREVDQNQPVQSITSMDEVIAATTAEPRFQTRLLGVFAIVALALSAIGIYGVLAYSVTERTREIGIRIALGAETSNVMRMVLRRTLALAAAGIALGTAGALAVTRVLGKLLFDVKPADPATFVGAAVLLAAVALCAGLPPARRATRVDPVVALRYE
jgi:putative ABC transport system permease protein